MLSQFSGIFVGVILPILVMVAMGALLQRLYPLHTPTLSRLNIYLFIPAFLFVRVSESTLSWSQIGGIVTVSLIPMAVLGVMMFVMLRRHASGPIIGAMLVGGLVFNAGNFGIPVAELTFGQPGGEVQALVVMMSNLSLWGIGYITLALAKGDGWKGALGYLRLPMIYVLVAAFAVRETQITLPGWLTEALGRMAPSIVPLALVTLGAQLAQRARRPNWRVVGPVMFIKLAMFPALTAGLVWASNLLPWSQFHLWPWPGAQLIIASAAPTAVNTLLLTLELDGDADLAADCVFWTTIVSALSVTAVIAVVLSCGGGPN